MPSRRLSRPSAPEAGLQATLAGWLRARLSGEQREQRLELDLGLRELRGGLGVGDDADSRVAVGESIAQQRAAQGDAELAVAGTVGPADRRRRTSLGPVPRAPVSAPARAHAAPRRAPASDAGARPARSPRAGGPAGPGSGSRDAGCSRPARASARRGAVTQTAWSQGAFDAPRHDRLLCPVLDGAQQLLAEVVVDGRVGAAPRRAGERDRADALSLAPHEQLGARAEGTRRPVPRRRRCRLPKPSRNTPKIAAGSCGRGARTSTSRASTIFSSSPPSISSTARATAAS